MREDLVHVAFLKVAERSQREGSAVPNASYLWRVAFTAVIDELRKMRRGEAYAVDVASRGETAASGPHIGLEIDDCLGRLSEDRRVAVTLYLQGFRMSETAVALAWAEKRVENLLYRGLKELRLCLGEKGVTDA
jgi:RNA polymerase sigma-70 factor (ECF subfamily)